MIGMNHATQSHTGSWVSVVRSTCREPARVKAQEPTSTTSTRIPVAARFARPSTTTVGVEPAVFTANNVSSRTLVSPHTAYRDVVAPRNQVGNAGRVALKASVVCPVHWAPSQYRYLPRTAGSGAQRAGLLAAVGGVVVMTASVVGSAKSAADLSTGRHR